MFLSKLVLNVRNPMTRRDLASPYEMHRTILNGGFDGLPKDELGRVLFRVDTDRSGSNPFVLVQADTRPDWSGLPPGYVTEDPPAVSDRLLDFLHQSATAGNSLRFRLRANPTKRQTLPPGEWRGKPSKERPKGDRVGLLTEVERVAWLLRKGESGGFKIPGAWMHPKNPTSGEPERVPNFRVDVIPEGRARNDKAGHREGAFVAVRFEGVLEVTDPVRFVRTVRDGVGSAKGFGFGLLSVALA